MTGCNDPLAHVWPNLRSSDEIDEKRNILSISTLESCFLTPESSTCGRDSGVNFVDSRVNEAI